MIVKVEAKCEFEAEAIVCVGGICHWRMSAEGREVLLPPLHWTEFGVIIHENVEGSCGYQQKWS